jgi:hypothetical protein
MKVEIVAVHNIKERQRRKITVTSSLKEISKDPLVQNHMGDAVWLVRFIYIGTVSLNFLI